MLQNQRLQRAQLIFTMVLVYAVCCLPFSLKNALSLWFPLANDNIFNNPVMLAFLYFLCSSQFSLNFLIYTIIPTRLRDAHKILWTSLLNKVQSCFSDLPNNFSYRKILKSLSIVSGQSTTKSFSANDNEQLQFPFSSPKMSAKSEFHVSSC